MVLMPARWMDADLIWDQAGRGRRRRRRRKEEEDRRKERGEGRGGRVGGWMDGRADGRTGKRKVEQQHARQGFGGASGASVGWVGSGGGGGDGRRAGDERAEPGSDEAGQEQRKGCGSKYGVRSLLGRERRASERAGVVVAWGGAHGCGLCGLDDGTKRRARGLGESGQPLAFFCSRRLSFTQEPLCHGSRGRPCQRPLLAGPGVTGLPQGGQACP
jgi:hypothetical protein